MRGQGHVVKVEPYLPEPTTELATFLAGASDGLLEEGKLCHRPGTGLNVMPPLASEPFVSDVQERYTEIDEVDGIKLRDGKVLVHELDVVT